MIKVEQMDQTILNTDQEKAWFVPPQILFANHKTIKFKRHLQNKWFISIRFVE